MSSFNHLATVPCSTKRADITAGKRGDPIAELSGLCCTPLDPVDGEIAARAGLETPVEVWQTFISGNHDIVSGDFLTVSNVDYPIRAVWDYQAWDGLSDEDETWKWLILEEIKSS